MLNPLFNFVYLKENFWILILILQFWFYFISFFLSFSFFLNSKQECERNLLSSLNGRIHREKGDETGQQLRTRNARRNPRCREPGRCLLSTREPPVESEFPVERPAGSPRSDRIESQPVPSHPLKKNSQLDDFWLSLGAHAKPPECLPAVPWTPVFALHL